MCLANKFFEITSTECLKIDFKHSVEIVKEIIGVDKFEQAMQFKIKSPLIQQINSSNLLL